MTAEAAELWKAGSFTRRGAAVPRPLFGQVHEDSAVEVFAWSHARARHHAVVIGSGGCTAFALLSASPDRLSIVDINPAQLWLIELKRAAFRCFDYETMRSCLDVNARPHFAELRSALSDDARNFWDRNRRLLAHGLNQAGIAERNMRRAMLGFRALVPGERAIRQMLAHTNLRAQREDFQCAWDTWRWRALFRVALNRRVLRLAYAPEFLASLPADFSAQIRAQVSEVFLRFPAATNPYLWQTFLAAYPPVDDDALPIHLQRRHFAFVREGLDRCELIQSDLAAWLKMLSAGSVDFFALSNILEVTVVEYPPRLFEAIEHAAAPGAIVCLRSIFAVTPKPSGARWAFDSSLSDKAQEIDRSLGCRHIRIYRLT